ncbi:hypothetical protein [Tenacibaculum agarivorans]|uniref:hypothetical protein n=1 Tax=Tenacibaculum agarivorans TaxID=1908389 RepID=UPI00094B988B|nr:hypothetical protein [Tenacibaculum agarivorans]
MKIIAFVFSFFIVLSSWSQVARDSVKVIEIPMSYANQVGEPLTVKKDSLYVFKTSEVYLVNKKSFLAMKNIYQTTIDQDKMTKELVEKYTATLRRNIDLERQLKINFSKSDSLDQKIHERNQLTLDRTQKALDYTINSLDRATKSLDIVEKESKRQRRKSVFEKILIGAAGIGAGILIGNAF